MRRLSRHSRLALVLLASGLLATLAAPQGDLLQAQSSATPRLLVVLVVDQMRADYLERFDGHWRDGFRTLATEGVRFDNARYPYFDTWTCAGHTTIGTGTLPRTHGMIANRWWHRDSRRSEECTDDAAEPHVLFGRSLRPPRTDPNDPTAGDSPKRLLVPTLADELRGQQPGARVVSLSLKARSAIGLAGHGGDAIIWFEPGDGTLATSTAFAPAPVPAVSRFLERRPIARDLDRPWTLVAPADSYLARDAGVGERPTTGWSGLFPHTATGQKGADAQFYRQWEYTPFSDEFLGELAASLVTDLELGQRGVTDFLGVSLSALDRVGHTFGPDSREVEDLLRRLDVIVGALIAHLDRAVGRDNYLLAFTSDHGIPPIAMAPRGGRITIDDLRERIEETLTEAFGPPSGERYVDSTTSGEIVLAPGVADQLRGAPDTLAAVVRGLQELPGVARVLRADELSEESSDPVISSAALSYVAGRSADLKVVPQAYWYFSPRVGGDNTTHGTLHEYDQRVPLVFLGGGLSSARRHEPVSPVDIAPTLAARVGLRLPRAEGRTLLD